MSMVPGLLLIEWADYFIKIPTDPTIATILSLAFMLFCWRKILKIKRDLENNILGRDGEREVAEELENLVRDTACYVFHDVVCENNSGEKFNIDHIIVSKYGVFIVETKTWRKPSQGGTKIDFDGKQVTASGHSPDSSPIDQARRNIKWLRGKISQDNPGRFFAITAIVVFPGWYVDKEQIKKGIDIWVMKPNYLLYEIPKQEPTLSENDIKVVNNVIRPLTLVQREPAARSKA